MAGLMTSTVAVVNAEVDYYYTNYNAGSENIIEREKTMYDIVVGDRNTILKGEAGKVDNSYINIFGTYNGTSYSYQHVQREVVGHRINVMGYGNSAVGQEITVIGAENGVVRTNNPSKSKSIKGSDLSIIGSRNNVVADHAFVLGTETNVLHNNSVVLGYESEDKEAVAFEKQDIADGLTFANFAGIANEGNGVVSVGKSGAERQIINVAAGQITESSTDAINGSQLYATNTLLNNVAKSVKDIFGSNATLAADGTITISDIGGTGKTTIEEAISSISRGSGSGSGSDQGNTGAVDEATAKKIEENAKGVSENKTNIQNNKNAIDKNTTAIANNTSAIADNKAAIESNTNSIASLQQQTSNLDSRMNKVGAGAAALAALHPLDFDANDKWNFAVGYGNYKDANAMAIGAFYRPNQNVMVNVAGSMGNGENMVNAGVSFKVGQGSTPSTNSKALAGEVESLKRMVQAQHEQIVAQQKQNEMQQEQIQKLLALVTAK